MSTLHLKITLESDVIVTGTGATVGQHRTMHRIRGGALLGACAAAGYAHPRSFDLFHSGRVRYGDGLPATMDGHALPVPMALHRRKTPAGEDTVQNLWNLAVTRPSRDVSIIQERQGYLDRTGQRVNVETSYSMRTAVGAGGRAREGFLFGFEALVAGQSFISTIEADDPELMDIVERRLVGQSILLGRSRTAEFGRARIDRATVIPWPVGDGPASRVCIWCISDVALRDSRTGTPRLVPEGADFGLPGARLDGSHSFVRTGRYSPFNGHRSRPDLEHIVILAGSVIVFESSTVALEAVRARVASGVGEYRAEGLGRVLVQPDLLRCDLLELKKEVPTETAPDRPGIPDDKLGRWLSGRAREEAVRSAVFRVSRNWAGAMGTFRGVTTAQWGEVRRLALLTRLGGGKSPELVAELRKRFGLTDPPPEAATDAPKVASRDRRKGRGATARAWSAERRQRKTAAETLVELIEKTSKSAPAIDVVMATELLGARMSRVLKAPKHQAQLEEEGRHE